MYEGSEYSPNPNELQERAILPREWMHDKLDLETGEGIPDRHQQDRIINAVKTWEMNPHAEPGELQRSFKDPVSDRDRSQFLDRIARGEVSDELLSQISHIWVNNRREYINRSSSLMEDDPKTWEYPTEQQNEIVSDVYDAIFFKKAQDSSYKYNTDLQEDRLQLAMGKLLQFSGTPSGYTVVGYQPSHIREFWRKYPHPEDFNDDQFVGVLKAFGNSNTDARLAIATFRQIMYGKQEEYYRQVQLLKKEARVKDLYQEVEISSVDEQTKEDILSNTEIHGDAFDGERLTVEHLKSFELGPRHKASIEQDGSTVDIYLSQVYEVHDRFSVVGYVPDNRNPGKFTTRTYYLSCSQGVTWRYLPEYEEGNGEIDWFGKGFDEHSIDVPIPFQKALANISTEQQDLPDLPYGAPDLVMAGTARKIGFIDEDRPPRASYYGEMPSYPEPLEGNFRERRHGSLVPPEKVEFNDPNNQANFDTMLDSWVQKRPDGSYYRTEVYPSNSGLLHMIGVRDVQKDNGVQEQVWYGMIENPNSKIGVTGLRTKWYQAGSLFTPIIEYDSQTGGYGSGREPGLPNYKGMWDRYISKMPWVERRHAAKHK